MTGDPAKLTAFANSEECRRATTRAQLIVDNFGVCSAMAGEEIGKQMAPWRRRAAARTR